MNADNHKTSPAAEPRRVDPFLNAGGWFIRGVMIIPVVATFLTALALLVYGAIETWHFVDALFISDHHPSRDEALLLAIEIVDLFLLATVVQVVSLGIYQLYFNQDLRLPAWLKINNLDDLKSKLVGVTITVLAVYFLGQAVVWTASGSPDILYLGGAVALVIVALTYFLSKIDDH
ncbi:YqhA family protein [Paradevosia shaoguanensis]|uniref:YqhA family protein n=1 Tax=Paradevosia shaoguanensis TaxID=1335043 RepID=A0AA41QKF6_9HYPH|nr:YqhA family protein [Paradevosia shaoguanensis]MCF1741687.1 YqhA family protein [Paradevosia shaoguanensis]MCI0126170.1 YqhA family protein [Paradevosia shaoguanensis]